MKRIGVIYYTQSGQLKQILDSLLRPLSGKPGLVIDYLPIRPVKPFPFPWTRREFLDVFPETVMELPVPLHPVAVDDQTRYDLIVLAFQPWYLSPSLPVTAFLKSPEAAAILKGTPYLTVIGSRNMWQGSFERVRAMAEAQGGRLCGNIAFIDRALNLVSVITIVYWMFTGRKDRYLGIFPRPGVSDEDIAAAAVFGTAIGRALCDDGLDQLDGQLRKLGAAEINDSLARLEIRAKKIFRLWAQAMVKKPNIRVLLLNLFMAELIFALIVISPLNSFFGMISKLFRRSGEHS